MFGEYMLFYANSFLLFLRSFGDSFKEGAIALAWEYLTVVFKLDEERRLYATYFGGDDKTPADIEARDIWLKCLPAERVSIAFRRR